METVIRSVVIAHGNLANQNISESGHNCKAVILMGPQSNTLSRFYLNLCASRYIVGTSVRVHQNICICVSALSVIVVQLQKQGSAATVDDILALYPMEIFLPRFLRPVPESHLCGSLPAAQTDCLPDSDCQSNGSGVR